MTQLVVRHVVRYPPSFDGGAVGGQPQEMKSYGDNMTEKLGKETEGIKKHEIYAMCAGGS